ncbi:PIN domain-containing protein [Amnibacterium endophyticum]|uniref:PIN domain-containing protein n=1 Tax=Amnibacterium endophyticum TaxID=2109337 RepID=A0ABW4LIM5_9MICO
MTVLDSSAVLTLLQGEPGAVEVERALEAGGCRIGAANWSEVAQKVGRTPHAWPLARDLLLGYDLQVLEVTRSDAELAASLWVVGSGLSLADRLCLALGERLDYEVLTADRAWSGRAGVRLVR